MVNYDNIFTDPKYNLPNKRRMAFVLAWVRVNGFKDTLDVGAGRGHYIKYLKKHGFEVKGIEPSGYLIEHDLKKLPVQKESITSYKGHHQALYCMDVLEHIDLRELDDNMAALSAMADHALIGIANHTDRWQDQELHLVQEDSEWWKSRLSNHYKSVNRLLDGDRYFILEGHN